MPGWFSARDALGHDQANLAADWCDGVREVRLVFVRAPRYVP
jgi:hypothetical protein